MALLEPQKSSIRRHLQYGNIGLSYNAAGGGSLGANAGFRYFNEWGDLEIRMDSLQPVDEACITGLPYGVMMFQGPDPNPGDELVFTIAGGGLSSTQTITVTAVEGQDRNDFCAAAQIAVAQNIAVNAAGIMSFAPIAAKSDTGIIKPVSELQFVARSSFTLAITSQTGNVAANIPFNNQQMDVMQTISGTNVYGFLAICNALYALIGTANDLMAVDKADVFTARPTEYRDRRHSWKRAVDDMADFLVARVNPQPSHGFRSNVGSL